MTEKKGMANGERRIREENSYSPFVHSPFVITTPADLHRLAASMRAHVAANEGVASRVVCLGRQTFQLMLRPGAQGALPGVADHQIQLLVSAAGYLWPDEWRAELCGAFGVPDGTLMVYDLVKRVHQVVKWTWTEKGPEVEQLQMSFASLEMESKSGYYERG